MKQTLKQFTRAAGMLLVAASSALAQASGSGSDIPGPGASPGSVAPFNLPVPAGSGSGGDRNSRSIPPGIARGIANAGASLRSAPAGGRSFTIPASARGADPVSGIGGQGGGRYTFSQSGARALGAVLGGNPTAAQLSTLTDAINGGPANATVNQSGATLAMELSALGSNPTFTTLTNAITAFNAAMRAIPAGAPIPPALVAIRSVLAPGSGRGR